MHYNTIIIGAGPAGLFLAQALGVSQKVLLLERNQEAGKKLLIAGSGQCNFTHAGDIEDFSTCYGDHIKFIKRALKSFDNKDCVDFFREYGVEAVALENGKVFPKSMKSMDIRNALVIACKKANVAIKYNHSVQEVSVHKDGFIVETDKKERYLAERVVLATGGKSYPKTGSDGLGYTLAEKLGHTIITPKPALTYVTIQEKAFSEIAGISFEDVQVTIWREHKKVKEHNGSILFTHKGLSGPGILDSSRWIQAGDQLTINFTYPKTFEMVKKEFAEEIPLRGKEEIGSFLKRQNIPKGFLKVILQLAEIDDHLPCARVSKAQRESLVNLLTRCPFLISGLGGYHVAMATAGGIHLKEVNQTTMESRKQKGLYFIGEVLDIDGNTGGYNIQAAFSMAFLCAQAIKNKQ